MVRVRFAPSPTGLLHIGSARTALFNWLFARAHKGAFVLRIEDTDIERSKEDFVDEIMNDLRWLGLDWDEGPDKGGEFGPYRQSDRVEIYRKYIDKLLKDDKAYYCFCSDEDLKKRRAEALKDGRSPQYDKRCRDLSDDEIEKLKGAGVKPAIRFRVPDKTLVVNDIVRGEVLFESSAIEDFVIMKSTKTPSFHFAVVCDDCLMEISHIIRGEDHLPNTPKHLLLFEALGFKVPRFAHMSLTTAPGGERLSKRTGSTSIGHYRRAGYLPEALVNYLALLGWSPGGDQEVINRDEMIEKFKLKRLSRSSEAFDPDKLDWLSGVYIRNADIDRLAELSIPYLKKAGYIKGGVDQDMFDRLKNIIFVIKDRLAKISDVKEHAEIFFKDEFTLKDKDAIDVLNNEASKNVLNVFLKKIDGLDKIDEDIFKDLIKEIGRETNLKGASLYHPIRVALTGRLNGPELKLIIPILDKENCVKRVKRALDRK